MRSPKLIFAFFVNLTVLCLICLVSVEVQVLGFSVSKLLQYKSPARNLMKQLRNQQSNSEDNKFSLVEPIRPRRNRRSPVIRDMVRENILTAKDLVYPLFIQDGILEKPIKIRSMPGCFRHSIDTMLDIVQKGVDLGVASYVLFPHIDESLKSESGQEALNPNGLVPRAVKAIHERFPHVCVITDIALDPYSSLGHDGIVRNGVIVNDESVEVLTKQALMHAEAGADIVAPSDMMDGRVGAIREVLDANRHEGVSILSYTAKYASAFYGPFRDALDSHPGFGDKKTYQMVDPANSREALLEADLDVSEGADILMVKPGLPYLDIIRLLKDRTQRPIAAYQVSGEYAMIKAAASRRWINERDVAMESLLAFKRAGADIIFTYHALKAASWLKEDALAVYRRKPQNPENLTGIEVKETK